VDPVTTFWVILPPEQVDLQSALPHLVRALVPGGDFDGYVNGQWLDNIHSITKVEAIKDDLALHLAVQTTNKIAEYSPPQRLEFLAKRLLSGSYPTPAMKVAASMTPVTVLLGTPLYVALAD
jgi:hypothetical protein